MTTEGGVRPVSRTPILGTLSMSGRLSGFPLVDFPLTPCTALRTHPARSRRRLPVRPSRFSDEALAPLGMPSSMVGRHYSVFTELELTSEEKVAFGALVSRIPAPGTKIGPSTIQPVRWLVRTRAAAPDCLPDP
jgi:hypothetical protein